MGFFITAPTKEDALTWGERLADRYLQTLYRNTSVSLQSLEVIRGHITDDPGVIERSANHQNIPTVTVGEYPDMKKIILKNYGPPPW